MENKNVINNEVEKLINNNYKLVYAIMKTYNNNYKYAMDEVESAGFLGLIKAAQNYDKDKEANFATFATRCITNQINMAVRKLKRDKSIISFESQPIASDIENNELYVEDVLSSENDILEKVLSDEGLEEIMNIIFNDFNDKEALILLAELSGMNQAKTGEIIKCTQSHVSRITKKCKEKIKIKIINKDKYSSSRNKALFEVRGNRYKIIFKNTDVQDVLEYKKPRFINNSTIVEGNLDIEEIMQIGIKYYSKLINKEIVI